MEADKLAAAEDLLAWTVRAHALDPSTPRPPTCSARPTLQSGISEVDAALRQEAAAPHTAAPAPAPRARSAAADVGEAREGALPSSCGPDNTRRIVEAARGASSPERVRQADKEKDKGNDHMRAKEYQQAGAGPEGQGLFWSNDPSLRPDVAPRSLHPTSSHPPHPHTLTPCLQAVEAYTVSLELNPHSHTVFSNRAVAFIKLALWHDALSDCSAALALDPGHTKSLLRRSHVLSELADWQHSLLDAEAGLEKARGGVANCGGGCASAGACAQHG